MFIGSSSPPWLCSGVPGLQARIACMVLLGLLDSGDARRLQPTLAASAASLGSSVAVADCTGAILMHHTLCPSSPAFTPPPCLLPLFFPFGETPSLSFCSQPVSFLILPALTFPSSFPLIVSLLLSTSDPYSIASAGCSSPGSHQQHVTDTTDQQEAAAQAWALALSSCPSALHWESSSLS